MLRTPTIALAALLATAPAWAQGYKSPSGFDDAPPSAPNQEYRGSQGFSFQGDQLPPSYDRSNFGQPDPRYSQTYREQEEKVQKPGGGCLKYGAAGAVGGHLAGGHAVLGAIAGCAAGRIVRNRDQARIEQQQQQQQQGRY